MNANVNETQCKLSVAPVTRRVSSHVMVGAIALGSLAALSTAQIGTIDQISPVLPTARWSAKLFMNAIAPWQQEVTPGVTGTLEGIKLRLHGSVGASFRLRIRGGPACSARPVLAELTVVKSVVGDEAVFVPLLPFQVQVTSGQSFVIETGFIGFATVGMYGSYIAPTAGPALYSGPLFFGSQRFQDGGWRQGFETYVITQPPLCLSDINGDGGIDGDDVTAFFDAWVAGGILADVNSDGGVDGADVSSFFENWVGSIC
jgi:hypothetical protein